MINSKTSVLLFFSDSEKDFLVQDINWMSSLENSKWLSLVSQCMAVSIETMDLIVNKQKTVVIKGR